MSVTITKRFFWLSVAITPPPFSPFLLTAVRRYPWQLQTIPFWPFPDRSIEMYVTNANSTFLSVTVAYDCPWKYKLSLFRFFLTAVQRNTWQLQTFFFLLPTADYDCPWQLQTIPFWPFSWLKYRDARDRCKLSAFLFRTAEYDCPWKYKLSLFRFSLTAVQRNTWQLQTFFFLLPTADYDCPWQLQAIPFRFFPDCSMEKYVTFANFPFFLTAEYDCLWLLQTIPFQYFPDCSIEKYVTVTNNPPHTYFFFMTAVERCMWQLEWREIFTAVAVEDAREVLSIKGCTLRTPHRVLNVFALHRLNAVEKLPAVVTVFKNAATQSGATLRGEVVYLSLGCRSWKRNGEC